MEKNMLYTEICKKIQLEKLILRRESLCLNFAKKALKHEKFKDWFVKQEGYQTHKTKFIETISRGNRLNKSPIPYLTRLLNK